MARLRKAARIWKNPAARALAKRVLVSDDGPVFTIEPETLFGRDAPLEVELGAGKGDFIIEQAASNPGRNFLAVELAASVARVLAVRVGRSELPNLKVARMDARTLVNLLLPDASVSVYHIYFPDPWPKERHLKHRLFSPFLVANLARTLGRGNVAYTATDVPEYARIILRLFECAGFRRVPITMPGAERSNFARKYIAEGRALFAAALLSPGGAEPHG
jgi:tRNA (guanine-N7-)-methyltransferase